MRSISRAAFVGVLGLFISFSILAQDRGSSGSASGSSSSSIGNRGVASSSPSVSSSSSVTSSVGSRDYSGGGSYVSSGSISAGGSMSRGSSGSSYVPDVRTSSFNSIGSYYQFQDYFYYLQTHYYMNSSYFGRFYRNREPLVTPELLKLTVRQPLRLSNQLLTAVDELEGMLKDNSAGKPVEKAAIAAKTEEIRDLAKKIRKDESLAFFDQRRDKEILKLDKGENLGLEAIAQLREIATDLNTQLKGMYTQSKPSTVSIQSLTAPSFESLTKGIDKLTKVIDNSARRL